MTWARLLAEGAYNAWIEAQSVENRLVEISIATPITNGTEYHKWTPEVVCREIVDYYNVLNTECTGITFLEKYQSTRHVKTSFLRHCFSMGWSKDTLTSSMYEAKLFQYANSLYAGRWPNYHAFEICASAFKIANSVV